MTILLAATEGSMTWPEAVTVLGGLAFSAFFVWLIFR